MTFKTARNFVLIVAAVISLLAGSVYWFGHNYYSTQISVLKNQVKSLESEVHVTQRKIEDLQKQYDQVNNWMGKEAKSRVKTKVQAVKNADANGIARILVDYVRSDTGHGGNGNPVSGDDLGSQ